MKSKLAMLTVGILLLSSVFCLATDTKWRSPIEITPASPNAGDSVTFKCKLKSGGGPAANVQIIGKIDGAQEYTHTYASMATDEIQWPEFTWTATAGNHTVDFVIVFAGDANQGNNTRSATFTVGGVDPDPDPDPGSGNTVGRAPTLKVISSNKPKVGKQPDFKIIKKLTLEDLCNAATGRVDATVEDFQVDHRDGDVVYFKVTIKNLGKRCIKKLEYYVHDSKGHYDLKALGGVPPNYALLSEQTITIIEGIDKNVLSELLTETDPDTGLPRNYSYFRAWLDPRGILLESNEANNKSDFIKVIW